MNGILCRLSMNRNHGTSSESRVCLRVHSDMQPLFIPQGFLFLSDWSGDRRLLRHDCCLVQYGKFSKEAVGTILVSRGT